MDFDVRWNVMDKINSMYLHEKHTDTPCSLDIIHMKYMIDSGNNIQLL